MRHTLLRRPPWLEVFHERIELPDGREVEDFYGVPIPEYAMVAALDYRGAVLMERHYRHGPRSVTWSLPSIDPGETAEQAPAENFAKRPAAGYWDRHVSFVRSSVSSGLSDRPDPEA